MPATGLCEIGTASLSRSCDTPLQRFRHISSFLYNIATFQPNSSLDSVNIHYEDQSLPKDLFMDSFLSMTIFCKFENLKPFIQYFPLLL